VKVGVVKSETDYLKKLYNNTNVASNISYMPMFLQFFLWTSLRIWPML